MLVLYLALLIPALYWVSRILLPEMSKAPLPQADAVPDTFDYPQTDASGSKIEKLEILLAEKNRDISLLETQLKAFQVQISAFDKLKTLLEEEIRRLKEQNRIFRSELGLPAGRPRENSIK